MPMKRIQLPAILMVAALTFMSPVAAQMIANGHSGEGESATPGVLRPVASPYGQSYGEWSAAFWQWLSSLPVDQHPLFDTADCQAGQSGQVWFLGGTFSILPDPDNPSVVVGEATRDCTVPSGKAIFFPIINVVCSELEDSGATEADLRACANQFADHMQDLQATLDGHEIQHLELYRTESPLFEIGPLPDNNVFDAAPGTTTPSVGDGYYLMLAPLSRGRHEIRFSGSTVFTAAEDGFDLTFRQDITYHVSIGAPRTAEFTGQSER